MKCTTREQAAERYGEIDLVNRVWPKAIDWLSFLNLPPELTGSWVNALSGSPVRRIYCNKDIQAPLMAALIQLSQERLTSELVTLDGCWNIRPVRGSSLLSTHAYGVAIDLNVATNKLGEKPTLSAAFVKCFTDQGFNWGGLFKDRVDGQHFSYAWEGGA